MTYLDTNKLRHLVADGQTLAKETVLDLLTRVERQQDKELQQLALEKHPVTPPPLDPAKDQVVAYSQHFLENGDWLVTNPILHYIIQAARELEQEGIREGLTYDPASIQLQISPDGNGNLVRLIAYTKPRTEKS